jgi:hypothetical protein
MAKESENWKKVESEYVIPENGKELSSEEIENNVEKMTYHKKLGLFEEPALPKPKPPTEKSFKFSDDKVPTIQEYNEIRNEYGPDSYNEYGPDSYEAKKAMELYQKHK